MNNFIGNNINAIRVHYGLSQDQLSDITGVSQTAVSAWECGESTPRKTNVLRILDALPDLSFDDVMSEENGFAKRVLKKSDTSKKWVDVPLYGSVAAGIPIEMIECAEMKEVPQKFYDEDPDCFLVIAKGNSENRRGIMDGDFVLVSPKKAEQPINPHELYLTAVNGNEATLKQVNQLENGVELIPDSYDPTYSRQIYNFNEIDTPPVTILAGYMWHCKAF